MGEGQHVSTGAGWRKDSQAHLASFTHHTVCYKRGQFPRTAIRDIIV